MKSKRIISIVMLVAMLFTPLTTYAGVASTTTKNQNTSSSKGKVYYLNFSPEHDNAWQKIAGIYTKKTGVEVEVVSVSNPHANYEETLAEHMSGEKQPTLFCVYGTQGYKAWKNHCLDLSDTKLAGWVRDKGMLMTEGKKESIRNSWSSGKLWTYCK